MLACGPCCVSERRRRPAVYASTASLAPLSSADYMVNMIGSVPVPAGAME